MQNPTRNRIRFTLDTLAFSGLWAGGTAGALTWAAGSVLAGSGQLPGLAWACLLAFAGTVVVYSVDRLRDVDRDSDTSPARSAFVSRHPRALIASVTLAILICVPAVASLPPGALLLCGAVMWVGLLHRRLKNHRTATWLYVTLAWVMIVVGLPALLVSSQDRRPLVLVTVAFCLALSIASNVIASQLRGMRFDANAVVRLRKARRLAILAVAIPWLVPGVAPLSWVGLAVWLSLAFFRPDERYGLVVLDGALILGGLMAGAIAGG